MIWKQQTLPYARASLSSIIADLELLTTGEAAVRLLTKDQCVDKLRRLDNLGYPRHSIATF